MFRVILAFVLLPTIVFAQKTYVDDVYGNVPLEIKIDTTPERRWFITNFEQGEVFLVDGTSQKGMIKFNGTLKFKNLEEDKQIKFNEKDVKSFNVGNETYIVVKDFKYQAQRMWGDMKKDMGYLKNILEGEASIYFNEVAAATSTPGVSTRTTNYYIKLSSNDDYILLSPNKKKFIEQISNLFPEQEEMLAYFNDKKYKHRSINELKNMLINYNAKYSRAN